MDPPAPNWWPQNGRRCPQPCCKSWRWIGENTVQLEHNVLCLWLCMTVYFTYDDLWNKNQTPCTTGGPVFKPTVLMKLIKLIKLIKYFISSTVTYATYDLLMQLMIYLWFTYDLLMKWGRGVCLSYLWKLPSTYFTYENLCLLMLLILLMPGTNNVLHLYYLRFTYELLMIYFWNGQVGCSYHTYEKYHLLILLMKIVNYL